MPKVFKPVKKQFQPLPLWHRDHQKAGLQIQTEFTAFPLKSTKQSKAGSPHPAGAEEKDSLEKGSFTCSKCKRPAILYLFNIWFQHGFTVFMELSSGTEIEFGGVRNCNPEIKPSHTEPAVQNKA